MLILKPGDLFNVRGTIYRFHGMCRLDSGEGVMYAFNGNPEVVVKNREDFEAMIYAEQKEKIQEIADQAKEAKANTQKCHDLLLKIHSDLTDLQMTIKKHTKAEILEYIENIHNMLIDEQSKIISSSLNECHPGDHL